MWKKASKTWRKNNEKLILNFDPKEQKNAWSTGRQYKRWSKEDKCDLIGGSSWEDVSEQTWSLENGKWSFKWNVVDIDYCWYNALSVQLENNPWYLSPSIIYTSWSLSQHALSERSPVHLVTTYLKHSSTFWWEKLCFLSQSEMRRWI